jgi:hypothetical protein
VYSCLKCSRTGAAGEARRRDASVSGRARDGGRNQRTLLVLSARACSRFLSRRLRRFGGCLSHAPGAANAGTTARPEQAPGQKAPGKPGSAKKEERAFCLPSAHAPETTEASRAGVSQSCAEAVRARCPPPLTQATAHATQASARPVRRNKGAHEVDGQGVAGRPALVGSHCVQCEPQPRCARQNRNRDRGQDRHSVHTPARRPIAGNSPTSGRA